jgi:prepilin-type N-terminal cleavage/methylation domain-containing protein
MNPAASLCRKRFWQRGFTLVELLIVVSITAIMAAAAVQAVAPLSERAVDDAGSEIAQALRFAQDDAIRSGMPRVVSMEPGNVVRVFQLKYVGVTAVEDTANPVTHPADKQSYKVTLGTMRFMSSALVTNSQFTFADATTTSQLAFSAAGEPVKIVGPAVSDVKKLVNMQITVSSGPAQRSVSVDPATGRISML